MLMTCLLRCFKPLQYKKKQNLLVEGEVCDHNYFLVKGRMRLVL